MKFMKKSCAVLLSLLMVISCICFSVTAEETGYNGGEYTYSLSEDKATITGFSYVYEDPDLTDSLVIPEKLDGHTVVAIGEGAFKELGYFTSIKLADTIETIGKEAFKYCTELEEVVLSENLKSIGEYAFASCGELKSIDIPASVESIGDYAFNFCLNLASINVDENNAVFTSENGVLFNKDKTSILCYPAKYGTEKYEIPASVTEIAAGAFSGNIIVKEIVIPESVQKIGASAFNNCRSIEKINIPDGIKEISLWMFYYCVALDNVVVPDSVTVICDSAFAGCHSLKSIVMSKNVTSIGAGAFFECASLESIEFGDKLTAIGAAAFDHCIALESFDIPASVETITGQAFGNCSKLKTVFVPSGVKFVGGNTFAYCGALETIEFEDGITEIPERAMVGCVSLKSVTLPSTLEKIGLRAFADDAQLADVYFNGTQEEWEAIEIAEGNEPLLNATIHFAEDVRGDVNSDSFVNATDALVILRHAVRIDELTGNALEKADVNADGFVNSSDALVVLRIAVGLENSEPETKEEIVEFYNTCVQKSSEQNKIVMEGFTDLSFTVNKFLVDGREDREVTESYEDELNAIEYDDVNFTFINGETEDGYKSEEVVLSAQIPLDEVDTASIEQHGDGYKITFTLYPSSYTLSEDELTGAFENYKSYSEENYGMEVLAVTDGEGRIVLLDLHYIQNVKATEIYEGIEFYMDIEADQRDIYTFAY